MGIWQLTGLLAAFLLLGSCSSGWAAMDPVLPPAATILVSPGDGAADDNAAKNVLTYHNDNARTGQALHETILTPDNVNVGSFGKLFVVPFDGKVDAEPLYASGIRGHNLLVVATEHDSVYALDADNGAPVWRVSMLAPGETPSDDRGCSQVTPEIGITATPVIDRKTGRHGTVYVVAMSKDRAGRYFQRLHALDLASGAEQFGGPREIHASFPGRGDNSIGNLVVFDPAQYKERPGLLLVNGMIYTSWSSHCDIRPHNNHTRPSRLARSINSAVNTVRVCTGGGNFTGRKRRILSSRTTIAC